MIYRIQEQVQGQIGVRLYVFCHYGPYVGFFFSNEVVPNLFKVNGV